MEQNNDIKYKVIASCATSLVQGALAASIFPPLFTTNNENPKPLNYLFLQSISLTLLTFMTFRNFREINRNFAQHSWRKQVSYCLTTYMFGQIVYQCILHLSGADGTERSHFGLALWVLSQVVYHSSEFLFVCVFHIKELSWKSFLLNHSLNYTAAFILAVTEYTTEYYYTQSTPGGWKLNSTVIAFGLILSTIGQVFRISSFFTAGSNFHHIVQTSKRQSHQLVTYGIYAIIRHPSYLGFYMQSLGGQIMLVNPLSFLIYALSLWFFFYQRIKIEENLLYRFFGMEYIQYRNKTPVYIPFMDYFLNRRMTKTQ